MMRITNLYFKIGNFELKVPELSFSAGNIYIIRGENGSGKTTLLRLICGLYRQSSGEIEIFGKSNRSEDWLYKAGIYLDESFLIDYLTPMEFLEFRGLFYNIDKREIKYFAEKINNENSYKLFTNDKLIRELSQGNRKKVGIFSSFLHDPDILIFDEPFENLDQRGRMLLVKLLEEGLEGKLAIVTIHHKVELDKKVFSKRVIELEMRNGVIVNL